MTKTRSGKTSKADFELYISEVKGFIEFFGLKGWQLGFEHRDINNRAELRFNEQGRQAIFTLGRDWTSYDTVSPDLIRRSAFHEVCELILADYYAAAVDTEIGGVAKTQRLERIGHTIIRTLENVILPLLPAKD